MPVAFLLFVLLQAFQNYKRFERSPQLRGDRREVVAITDCWLCLMMAENLFSKTIIRRRQ